MVWTDADGGFPPTAPISDSALRGCTQELTHNKTLVAGVGVPINGPAEYDMSAGSGVSFLAMAQWAIVQCIIHVYVRLAVGCRAEAGWGGEALASPTNGMPGCSGCGEDSPGWRLLVASAPFHIPTDRWWGAEV